MSRYSFVSRITTSTSAFTRELFNLIKTPLGVAWLVTCMAATVLIVAVTSMTFAAPTTLAPVQSVLGSFLFVWVIVMAIISAALVAVLSATLVMRYQRSRGK